MMFEAGRTYSFATIEHDGETHWSGKVTAVEAPLIRVEQPRGEVILNTHCSTFKSAQVWSAAQEKEAEDSAAEWGDLLAVPPGPGEGRLPPVRQ